MDQIPELVKAALSSACQSGRSLSWKVQENNKGILIQLVWKAEPVSCPAGGNAIRVGSNWKTDQPEAEPVKYTGSGNATEAGSIRKSGLQCFVNDNQSSNAAHNLPRKKRICPSRARRNAKRLQAFLDRKVPLVHHAPQKVLESVSQESSKVCLEETVADADRDDDLKAFLDNEVSC